MFLVSFPFAVIQGGYWAILGMIVTSIVCYYTGMILVDCLYEPLSEEHTGSVTEPQKVFNFGHPPKSQTSQLVHVVR
ncbi:hypothetical protein Ciccas_007066, partial [Cichlidogyrus casuarinus]